MNLIRLYNNYVLIDRNMLPYDNCKDFPKERYNTYAKSCNSNLYTKYPGATYSG